MDDPVASFCSTDIVTSFLKARMLRLSLLGPVYLEFQFFLGLLCSFVFFQPLYILLLNWYHHYPVWRRICSGDLFWLHTRISVLPCFSSSFICFLTFDSDAYFCQTDIAITFSESIIYVYIWSLACHVLQFIPFPFLFSLIPNYLFSYISFTTSCLFLLDYKRH